MAAFLVDERDQLFTLKDMLKIDELYGSGRFADSTEFEMLLDEAHKFARAEFYPTVEPGDQEGAAYDPTTFSIKLPESYQAPYRKFCEGGWLAMCDSPEVGGFGFPMAVGTAVSEIFYAAGFYIYGAAELSHAGAKVLEKYGSPEQKEFYMSRLFSGQWMGTMCLTEPDAGSDVGKVATKATPMDDGTFAITGTKIFITAGEHDLTENIIHMVLARMEGDPPGTRGLSLFIVPKHLVSESGKLVGRNDVACVGIEHKMGLHGLVTCTMAFGGESKCTGYLLGERGKGIVEMFNMMNEQRLLVGLQGLSYSSAAFLHAVDYAAQRKQGPSVDPQAADKHTSVAIIEHPDVQRMLLTMKAQVEGSRALAYYTSLCLDYAAISEGEEQVRWQGMVELLTPVVKAYLTAQAWEVTATAIQCAGGYGYCADYPFERLARDCKVATIYEGANGIQAIDLVCRKILGNRLVNFTHLMDRISLTVTSAREVAGLEPYAVEVAQAKQGLEMVAAHLISLMEQDRAPEVYAKASPFLEAMGDVLLGWMHLWQLTITHPRVMAAIADKPHDQALADLKGKKSDAFYYGKACSAQFFIATLLKRTQGKFAELTSNGEPVIQIFEQAYTG